MDAGLNALAQSWHLARRMGTERAMVRKYGRVFLESLGRDYPEEAGYFGCKPLRLRERMTAARIVAGLPYLSVVTYAERNGLAGPCAWESADEFRAGVGYCMACGDIPLMRDIDRLLTFLTL